MGEKEKGLENMAVDLGHHIEVSSEEGIEEYILKSMETFYQYQNKEVSSIIYLSLNKKFVLYHPKQEYMVIGENAYKEIEYVKKNKKSHIGVPYPDRTGGFSFNIVEPVMSKNEMVGIIFGKIKLGNMHDLLVKPIKIGEYGYAVVKNSKGRILMHPVKSHIGDFTIRTRQEKYPNLDYGDLYKLLEKQTSQKEGFHIYSSYWWPQEKLIRTKKINVFSRIQVPGDYWIIAVVTSYDEINKPIIDYLIGNIFISTLIILAFSFIIFWIVRMIKNKEAYEMETNYLRELNKSTEELAKKDAELHHRRRLETIGTLTGGIAHEFNNILTPIMGHSEILLRNLDPDLDSYEDAEAIYNSTKRAQEIIDQIRIFSGDKNIKTKYKITSVNNIINDALKFAKFTMPSNIKMTKEIKPNCGYIYTNETQIHQIILNLCTNAYNAMKEKENGMLKVTVESVKYDNDAFLKNSILENREYVKISFIDNGCGIDEEIIEKIFDPFFTKKLSEKSSGLGLAIVQGIVTKHGGIISVTSEKGIGTRFDVYMPKAEQEKTTNNISSENIKGNESVLIIDDDKDITEMLKKGLTELGYDVTIFTDGTEVLKKFNYIKENFEIVVTDLTMPKITGIQIAKKIKRNKPDIKVILITAYSDEPLEEYMQSKILDEYLIKPVSAVHVSKAIRKIMDNN
jgi:signal transduction histidine kinase/ActR/RegA family two-component response regulator